MKLLEMLGARFHGVCESDAELLADDPVAWPPAADTEIRAARAAYAADDLTQAADRVLAAQSIVDRAA